MCVLVTDQRKLAEPHSTSVRLGGLAEDQAVSVGEVEVWRQLAADRSSDDRRRRVALVSRRLVAGEVWALVEHRRRRRVAVVPTRLVAGQVRALVVLHRRRRGDDRDQGTGGLSLTGDLHTVDDLRLRKCIRIATGDCLGERLGLQLLDEHDAQLGLTTEPPRRASGSLDHADDLHLELALAECLGVAGRCLLFVLLGEGLAGLNLLAFADELGRGVEHSGRRCDGRGTSGGSVCGRSHERQTGERYGDRDDELNDVHGNALHVDPPSRVRDQIAPISVLPPRMGWYVILYMYVTYVRTRTNKKDQHIYIVVGVYWVKNPMTI